MSYPELDRQRAMLRLLHQKISAAHENGELHVMVSVEDVANMADEIGSNEAQSVALFQRLHREGYWSGNIGTGYTAGPGQRVPFAFAKVEDLTSKGKREIGELPDPADELVQGLLELAEAIEEQDLPPRQKTVAKQAIEELVHFVRGLPPGVAVEIGSRLFS